MNTNLILKSLLPTVQKALTEENITSIYNKTVMTYPRLGDKNICTLSQKQDGKIYLSVVSIKDNQIIKVHEQAPLKEVLIKVINGK